MIEAEETQLAYGCVFCVTGKEQAAAKEIERVCGDVRVMVARQVKPRTSLGKKYTEEAILFPGYIFFEAPVDSDSVQRFPKESILTVLTSEVGNWQLYGNDARFVQWLFSYNGLISFSKAYQEGEWVRIIEGPLKDLEAQIIRIDRRNRSGQVAVNFCNRIVKAWLGFEIVEKI